MRRPGDDQFPALLERAEDVQERDRVGPARERDEHTPAARKHVVLPDRPQDAGTGRASSKG